MSSVFEKPLILYPEMLNQMGFQYISSKRDFEELMVNGRPNYFKHKNIWLMILYPKALNQICFSVHQF